MCSVGNCLLIFFPRQVVDPCCISCVYRIPERLCHRNHWGVCVWVCVRERLIYRENVNWNILRRNPSIHLSLIHSSILQFIHSPIHPSIHLLTHLSILKMVIWSANYKPNTLLGVRQTEIRRHSSNMKELTAQEAANGQYTTIIQSKLPRWR